MSYMKFRFEPKNFFLGVGALMVAMVVPFISEPIISIITGIRSKLPWSKDSK